ncbi:MAG: hypothetical protein CL875_03200 [Dehalococcoidales bacterium]|nr:hypothetical protein [Dehalococcoidales bacterium]
MASSEIIEGLRTCELFALLNEEEMQTLTTSFVLVKSIKAVEGCLCTATANQVCFGLLALQFLQQSRYG